MQQPRTPSSVAPARKTGVVVWGCVIAALMAAGAVLAQVANPVAASSASSAVKASSSTKSAVTKPEWKDLSPSQQVALKPLAANWQTLNEAQKRKWLELSKNYASLPAPEQTKMHARMADWASLSPQQRAQARLNFAEHQVLTQGLTPEQRKAQWQAYQLLSPEEKQKLAASSPKPPAGAATVAKPADPLKNSPPPTYGTAEVLNRINQSSSTKINVAPHVVNSNRLMPQASAQADTPSPAASTTRQ
jgi:Protein of unknown function (DUF3106)